MTLFDELIVKTQVPVPVQAPLQPENRYLLAGVAVKVTDDPLTKASEQSLPQDTPTGEDTILPLPRRVTDNLYLGSNLKVAVMLLADVILTVQGPIPVQAPVQP